MASQWFCVKRQRVIGRQLNRPNLEGDAIPDGMIERMAPKIRTCLACIRLSAPKCRVKL